MSSTDFSCSARVYYEDTDAGGVVYYANYLKFFERARTEWGRAAGIRQSELNESRGLIFPVKSVAIEYHAPAKLDDELKLSAMVERVGRASIQFKQEIRRVCGTDSVLLADGRVTVVCVDVKDFRPRAIPDDILEKIRSQA
jgi:acyl-CoA thioester hydrolase